MELIWDSFSAMKKKSDLSASYVATPELLRVPLRQAVLYNAVWALCLAIKLALNYQLFIEMVGPTGIIVRTDFSCWTPWYGSQVNPVCATVSASIQTHRHDFKRVAPSTID